MNRIQMCLYAIKRQFMYRTPNAVLHMLGNDEGIFWFYECLLNPANEKKAFQDYFRVVVGLIISCLFFPFYLVYYPIVIFVFRRIYLHRLEIPVTTYCSLKCRDCSNLMQYYEHPYHMSAHEICNDIDVFLRGIYSLEQLVLLGGEPFMCPELKQVLEHVIPIKKVIGIKIISNGIARIDEEMLELLSNPKVRVDISDYGLHQDIINANCERLSLAGVNVLRGREKSWLDMGDMHRRNRSGEELAAQYRKCKFKCRCMLNGRLFICPRASHGTDLGLYDDKCSLNLRECGDMSSRELGNKVLSIYYNRLPIVACDYCDAGTDSAHEIPCGVQL